MNKKQAWITVCLVMLLVLTVPLSLWLTSLAPGEEVKKVKIEFSSPAGFYQDKLNIQLSASVEGTIWYTLDGSVPAVDNPASKQYVPEGGITLACGPKEAVYNIRAMVVPVGMESAAQDIFAQTYIIGKRVDTRYENPVLSLAGDPAELLEQTGILDMENRTIRGRESERAVYATLFDTDGSVILEQNCGVRVFGGASRFNNQPSLKLFARSEYDKENHFNCALYTDYNEMGALVADTKRLIIRNAGSDNGYAHIRGEFASKLSMDAGFEDVQAATPICTYINGEYFGSYWMVETFDASYFTRKYGKYDGRMIVMDNNIAYLEPDETDDEITLQIKEEYGEVYQQLSQLDLNEENNWRLLNDTIDVENFLKYMALENYFCNRDSMVNNFKTYRYYSEDGEYIDGTVFDGRYRFLLFDLDDTLGFGSYDEPGAEASILSTANRVGYDIFYNSLFNNILKTQAGRDYYVRYYLALANYYCEESRAEAILNEMHASREKELQKQYAETDFAKNNYRTPEDIDYNHVMQSLDLIKFFLHERPAWAMVDLEEAFDLSSGYELFLSNPGEAYISVDFASFSDVEFSGTYYSEIPTTITAKPKMGDRFDYWLVDGVEYEDETLVISGDMLQDESIYIECVTSRDEDAGMFITAIKSRGGSDYVELTNFSMHDEDLSEYKISDDSDRERASTLPPLMIAPGQTITVYCKNYTGAEAIGQPEVNFNIKAGETVYLFRKFPVHTVDVPRLGTKTGVYRVDVHSGKFYENL